MRKSFWKQLLTSESLIDEAKADSIRMLDAGLEMFNLVLHVLHEGGDKDTRRRISMMDKALNNLQREVRKKVYEHLVLSRSRDLLTGRTAVDIQWGTTWRVGATAVAERRSSSRSDVNPYDPSDAGARAEHVFRISRPNQMTEARADVAVQATATHFQVTIEVEVRVNSALHFTKRWAESVPRHYL